MLKTQLLWWFTVEKAQISDFDALIIHGLLVNQYTKIYTNKYWERESELYYFIKKRKAGKLWKFAYLDCLPENLIFI